MGRVGLLALVALAGCGRVAPAAVDAAPTSLPPLTTASYRAESNVLDEDGDRVAIVQIRSGEKVRLEFNEAEPRMVQILDPAAGAAYVILPSERMAVQGPIEDMPSTPAETWSALAESGAEITPSGACTGAGETGSLWVVGSGDGPEKTACVSADGIVLQASEGARVIWEVTRLTRGQQDPALFVVPAGYRIQDFPNQAKR